MPQKAKEFNINLRDTWINTYNIKKYVLPHYGIEKCEIKEIKFKNTDKQRAVYKVQVGDEIFCVKKVYLDKKQLLFVYSTVEWLYRLGINVPRFIPTNDGSRFVFENDMLFILTPWIKGEKCDFDNINHVNIAMSNLAKAHKVSKNFSPILGSEERFGFDDIFASYSKHFNQLLNSSNLAFRYKDKFSKIFLDDFENNITLAKISLDLCSTIDNKNLSRSLCHSDYVNKNLIFSDDNSIYMIDFDKSKMDYCVKDISYFFRRLLKREKTKWNLDLAINAIEEYNKINPLNLDEYKYIAAYLAFPQKYWRISRDYYNNIRKCNEKSFCNLLNNVVKKTSYQLEFMDKFLRHIENKFNISLN